MTKNEMLIRLWKKAQSEGELTFPCESYSAAYKLRFHLYNVCQKVMKDPSLDPELFTARSNTQIFMSKKEDEKHFITLKHMSSDPLMQALAAELGIDLAETRKVNPTELLTSAPVEDLSEDELSKALSGLSDQLSDEAP